MQPVVVQSGGCRGAEGSGERMKPNEGLTPACCCGLNSTDVVVPSFSCFITLQMMMVAPPPKKERTSSRKNRKVSENADWCLSPATAPFNQPTTSERQGCLCRALLPGAKRSAGTLLILICLSICPGSNESVSLSKPSICLLQASWAAAGR